MTSSVVPEMEWFTDGQLPQRDRAAKGASAHKNVLRPRHPKRFRVGDVVRIGADRLVPTQRCFHSRPLMRSLNEAVRVLEVRDDGRLVVERAVGSNPAQRVRRGDELMIIGAVDWE